MKKRARSERREAEREARKLVRDRQKLAVLLPGGAPERPLEVDSPSVIRVRAEAEPCPLCRGDLRLAEETAELVDGKRLRAAHLRCQRCGVARVLWFRLGSPLAN